VRWLNRDEADSHSEAYGVLQSVIESDGGQALKIMDKRGQVHIAKVDDIVAARIR
jgi:hypothetical protein